MSEVDVYATGVLRHLLVVGRVLNPWWLRTTPGPRWLPRHPTPELRHSVTRWRREGLRSAARGVWRDGRNRSGWRGYYAEPRVLPAGLRRIGMGWTRRRALRDLAWRIEAIR